MTRVELRDFSGGLNLRDSPIQVAQNETPDAINVHFDERGGVVARKGLTKDNSSATIGSGTDNIVNGFYSKALGYEVFQVGAELWKRSATNTYSELTRAASANAFTTAARACFVDFAGQLVMLHPVDGVLVYNGAGNITVAAAGVTGTVLAVWQNKLWAASGNQVFWSNAGSASTWTTASDFVRLRDLDDAGVTAMVPLGGALVVFKQRSMHRIYDSSTGANTTVSVDLGVVGPLAIVVVSDVIYGFSTKGIIATNGLSEPVLVSDKIEPLFHPLQLSMGQLDRICAGQLEDRVLFSYPRVGQTYNDRTLEYDPVGRSWAVHTIGASCWVTSLASARLLLSGAAGSGSGVRNVYQPFTGPTDDGTAISSRFQSSWVELGAMSNVRLRHMLAAGRGDPTFEVLTDFAEGGEQHPISFLVPNSAAWGTTSDWGSGLVWGAGTAREVYDEAFSLGVGRVFSFQLSDSGTSERSVAALLGGDGASESIGSWALYGLALDYVPLGRMA